VYEGEHVAIRTDLSPSRAEEIVRELDLARAAVLQAIFSKRVRHSNRTATAARIQGVLR
jgi:hypothetical protein